MSSIGSCSCSASSMSSRGAYISREGPFGSAQTDASRGTLEVETGSTVGMAGWGEDVGRVRESIHALEGRHVANEIR